MSGGRTRSRWWWQAVTVALAIAVPAETAFTGVASATMGSARDQPLPRGGTAQQPLATGSLLVARPGLPDPNFAQAIVLLYAYSPSDGAAGLIVNRRTTVRARRLLPDLPIAGGPDPLLFVGGPVARDEVLALVRAPFGDARARLVLRDVAIVGAAGFESAMRDDASADRLRLYSGYSGWGPGQLEREIARGDWRVTDGDADVVFSSDPDRLWREQLRRLMDRVVV